MRIWTAGNQLRAWLTAGTQVDPFDPRQHRERFMLQFLDGPNPAIFINVGACACVHFTGSQAFDVVCAPEFGRVCCALGCTWRPERKRGRQGSVLTKRAAAYPRILKRSDPTHKGKWPLIRTGKAIGQTLERRTIKLNWQGKA